MGKRLYSYTGLVNPHFSLRVAIACGLTVWQVSVIMFKFREGKTLNLHLSYIEVHKNI